MNKDKIEELIAASKLNELLHKKDVEESKKKSNVIIIVLAVWSGCSISSYRICNL